VNNFKVRGFACEGPLPIPSRVVWWKLAFFSEIRGWFCPKDLVLLSLNLKVFMPKNLYAAEYER
jgi:hypothetical protein